VASCTLVKTPPLPGEPRSSFSSTPGSPTACSLYVRCATLIFTLTIQSGPKKGDWSYPLPIPPLLSKECTRFSRRGPPTVRRASIGWQVHPPSTFPLLTIFDPKLKPVHQYFFPRGFSSRIFLLRPGQDPDLGRPSSVNRCVLAVPWPLSYFARPMLFPMVVRVPPDHGFASRPSSGPSKPPSPRFPAPVFPFSRRSLFHI